jgi:hypothetical protein
MDQTRAGKTTKTVSVGRRKVKIVVLTWLRMQRMVYES